MEVGSEPTCNVPPRRRTGPVLWGLRVLARRADAGLGGVPCRPATGTYLYLQWSRCDGIVRVASRRWESFMGSFPEGDGVGRSRRRCRGAGRLYVPNGLIGGQWLGRVDPAQLPGFGLVELELARTSKLLLYTCTVYSCCLEGHADLPPWRAREADGAGAPVSSQPLRSGTGVVSSPARREPTRYVQVAEPLEACVDSGYGSTSQLEPCDAILRRFWRRVDDSSRRTRLYTRESREAFVHVGTSARASLSRVRLHARG